MQMDYAADVVILKGGCVNYARAIEGDEQLKDACTWKEPLIDKRTGHVIGCNLNNHPAMARSSTCWRNVRSFCSWGCR